MIQKFILKHFCRVVSIFSICIRRCAILPQWQGNFPIFLVPFLVDVSPNRGDIWSERIGGKACHACQPCKVVKMGMNKFTSRRFISYVFWVDSCRYCHFYFLPNCQHVDTVCILLNKLEDASLFTCLFWNVFRWWFFLASKLSAPLHRSQGFRAVGGFPQLSLCQVVLSIGRFGDEKSDSWVDSKSRCRKCWLINHMFFPTY